MHFSDFGVEVINLALKLPDLSLTENAHSLISCMDAQPSETHTAAPLIINLNALARIFKFPLKKTNQIK